MSPDDFYESYKKGHQLVVPPMLLLIKTYIENAEKFPFEFEPIYDSKKEVPHIYPLGTVTQLLPLSNTFPPANRTNSFLIGDNPRVLIDPSPGSSDELNKF